MFQKNKSRKNVSKTYAILGLGRFGMALAMELAHAGAELIALDRDEEKVRDIREFTDNAFVVRDLDKKTLLETGVQNCDLAVVCIGEQMAASILTTLNLIALGVPQVIAKAISSEHGEILEKLGAQVVYPDRDMAIRLANRLEVSRMLDYIQLSEKLNISKLLLPEKMVGKTVLEVNLRQEFHVNIIAVENNGNLMEIVAPNYLFRSGDILFLSGSKEGLNRLSDWAEL